MDSPPGRLSLFGQFAAGGSVAASRVATGGPRGGLSRGPGDIGSLARKTSGGVFCIL